MRWLTALLLVLLLFLQYRLWLGQGGLGDMRHMKREVATQQEKNTGLAARNRVLEAEVADLKHGQAAIEERARTELGMVKKGETFYQIVAGKDAPQSPAAGAAVSVPPATGPVSRP